MSQSGLRTRAGSAALLAPAFLTLVWLGSTPWLIVMSVVVLLGSYELGRLIPPLAELDSDSPGRMFPSTLALLGVAIYFFVLFGVSDARLTGLSRLSFVVWLLSILFLIRPTGWLADPIRRWTVVVGGLLYISLFASFVTRLHAGSWPRAGLGMEESKWVFLLVLLVWASDSGAYFVGVRWGKTRLWPAVSPKKTWEGLWGGIVLTVICGVGLTRGFDLPLSDTQAAALGGLIGLSAPVGDLIESRLKRESGAKDTGQTIPGHGGVLDRFDALLFAAPLFYYYLYVIGR